MICADVEIRLFGLVVTGVDGKEINRYPMALTVNSEREWTRSNRTTGALSPMPT